MRLHQHLRPQSRTLANVLHLQLPPLQHLRQSELARQSSLDRLPFPMWQMCFALQQLTSLPTMLQAVLNPALHSAVPLPSVMNRSNSWAFLLRILLPQTRILPLMMPNFVQNLFVSSSLPLFRCHHPFSFPILTSNYIINPLH